ncbi:hypothetical protein ACYDHR_03295 [Klebsiella aerogenes]|uniref:hypothetical protein n=1 Tax=Klebsiella variicola TaxID=244366 RepID=UPI0035A93D89
MAISQQQRECGLRNLHQLRLQHWSSSSKAADWWDQLRQEQRGLVLYAAGICTNRGVHGSHLSKCNWRELNERLDYRAMIGLKRGITYARQIFEGFGPIPDSDFSRRTALRPTKQSYRMYRNEVQKVIAPHIFNLLPSGQGETQ